MFKFLKEKLKSVVSKFSKSVEEEVPPAPAPKEEKKIEVKEKQHAPKKEEQKKETHKKEKPHKEEKAKSVEQPAPEIKTEPKELPKEEQKKEEAVQPSKPAEEKGFFAKIKEKFAAKEEPKPVAEKEPEVKEKKGFFQSVAEKITTTKISQEKFEKLFAELEVTLLENNVALEVVDKIKEGLQKSIVDTPIKRGTVEDEIQKALKASILNLFDVTQIDLFARAKQKKPFVICLVGINGSGKTTTVAKLAHAFKQQGLSVVIAAADTFRAAAIHQLEEHATKLGVKLIKQDYGSDAASVAFDAIKHAEARNVDVVLIDTAGRLHSNKDLVAEMQKIVRVAKPDLKLFIGESITGNDCITQAQEFDQAISIDGIILAKADVDEKGGTAISISYVTRKPILYLGMGQKYDDLVPFDKEKLVERLGL